MMHVQGWRKSSYSNGTGGNCVEVLGGAGPVVPVRDSKDLARGHLLIPAASWASLAASVK